MKIFLHITLFLLCSCQIFAQNSSLVGKSVQKPPFRNDSQKGLYVGRMGADDVISGFQAALADALLDYCSDNQSSLNMDAYSTKCSGTCNIEIIDMASHGDEMTVLFRIRPDGKFAYAVENVYTVISDSQDGKSSGQYTMYRTIHISYTDPDLDTDVEWEYEELEEFVSENDKIMGYTLAAKSNVIKGVGM